MSNSLIRELSKASKSLRHAEEIKRSAHILENAGLIQESCYRDCEEESERMQRETLNALRTLLDEQW